MRNSSKNSKRFLKALLAWITNGGKRPNLGKNRKENPSPETPCLKATNSRQKWN